MARAAKSKKRSSAAPQSIHKAHGVISPRVQRVGPEHFGIVCVDCAKARSKWMLTDFYGRVLVPPTEVEHTQACLTAMIGSLRSALEQAGIRDQIVVIERTGRYHRTIQHAFAKAGFEVRIMHPLTTKQHRQPANPGNKTDDTDLAAMQRGAVNGFGLLEPPADPLSIRLQLLARHRRDLVEKTVALRCAARSTNIFMRLCQDTATVLKTSMMRGFRCRSPDSLAQPRPSSKQACRG